MAVRARDGRYTVEFEQQGIRVFRRPPPATTRAQAVALEAKLRQEIFDQRALDRKPDPSLEACVDLWLRDRLSGKKDQRMPRQNAEHLRPFLMSKSCGMITQVVREAIGAWTAAGLSGATINRRLSVMKASLRYAWQQGWVAENLSGKISKLPEPPGREAYLTPAQVKKLADAMPTPGGRGAILILAYTGLRTGEMLAIGREDISKDSITVRQSKSGKARTVPIPSSQRALLSALPLSLSYTQLHWQFRAARKAVGMEHVRLHDLRHVCASWLINAGVDLYTVGRILGHSTPVTTARYAHLAQGTLRKAMGKLR